MDTVPFPPVPAPRATTSPLPRKRSRAYYDLRTLVRVITYLGIASVILAGAQVILTIAALY